MKDIIAVVFQSLTELESLIDSIWNSKWQYHYPSHKAKYHNDCDQYGAQKRKSESWLLILLFSEQFFCQNKLFWSTLESFSKQNFCPFAFPVKIWYFPPVLFFPSMKRLLGNLWYRLHRLHRFLTDIGWRPFPSFRLPKCCKWIAGSL